MILKALFFAGVLGLFDAAVWSQFRVVRAIRMHLPVTAPQFSAEPAWRTLLIARLPTLAGIGIAAFIVFAVSANTLSIGCLGAAVIAHILLLLAQFKRLAA